MPVKMTSEDFSEYGHQRPRVPAIAAVNPAVLATGVELRDLHSRQWFPELEPTLRSLLDAEMVKLTEPLAPQRQITGRAETISGSRSMVNPLSLGSLGASCGKM